MADTTVKLKVLLESAGIKPTAQQLDNLNKKLQSSATSLGNVGKKANETKRNLEGVAQRSNRASKDFGRMSQGMGGLVQAYATVAANVFALSSAFLVLRRTADLSSMIKSAEDFSARYGVSVTQVTKQLQKATGGALSFAAALPVVNKAISAGVPIDKMEALAIAATKAAQTFGGSATDALNRFISASQRGRVEIIQTLGIVIKTEDAYERYGASIGKTAQELTAFDRQQAILNATIEASQNVFDKVNIDPNPFQQMLTTMVDLKDTIGTFITDNLTPMFNAFNKSKAAAAAFFAVIIGAVGGRIFPAISDQLTEMQKRSFESTRNATRIMQLARNKQTRIILETGVKQNKLTKDQLLTRSNLFSKYYQDRLAQHKTFGKSILNEQKQIDAAILNERRAAITRELNLRAKGKGSEKFKGVPSVALENERNRLILLTKETKSARAAVDKLTAAEKARNSVFKRGAANLTLYTTTLKANTVAFKAQIGTGFQRSFAQTQQSFILGTKMMARSWANFIKIAVAESKSGQLAMAAFARAVGRSAGLIAGAFAKALSAFSTITFVVSTGLFLWEKFGDRIRGITPEMRATEEAIDKFKESLKESNRVLEKGISLWGGKAISTLKDLTDVLGFVGGSFESISNNITNLFTDLISATEGLSFEAFVKKLETLREQAKETEKVTKIIGGSFATRDPGAPVAIEVEELTAAAKAAQVELNSAKNIVLTIAKAQFLPNLAAQFRQTTEFAEEAGISINNAFIGPSETLTSTLAPVLGETTSTIVELAKAGNDIALSEKIEEIANSSEDGARKVFLLQIALAGFYRDVAGAVSIAAKSTATSIKQLIEAGTNFQTYVLGLDKLKSQKSPYKEIFAQVINVENAIKDLIKNKDTLSGKTLDEIFAAKDATDELEYVRALLGDNVNSLESAEVAAAKLKATLEAQLAAQLLGALKLKTVQEKLNAAKSQNVRDDRDRIFRVAQINALEISQAARKADIAAAERDAAQAVLNRLSATKKISAFEKERREEEIRGLNAQVQALNAQERALIENNKVRLEALDIDSEILSNRTELINILIRASNIDKSLVGNLRSYLDISESIYLGRKAQLRIEKDQISIAKERILLQTKEGSDLQNRLLAVENAKLLLLKQQTAELERQQESRLGLELEQTTTIFSNEGMRAAAHFFRRAMEDEIPKLRSTFEILGVGLSKTLLDTFDLMVDNLLEGGKDFIYTIKEGLKASLRDVFGTALKERIKEAFISLSAQLKLSDALFPKETAEASDKQEQKEFRTNMQKDTALMAKNSTTVVDLLRSIDNKTGMPQGTTSSIFSPPKVGPLATPGGLPPLQGIGGILPSPAQLPGGDSLKNLENLFKKQIEVSKGPIEIAQTSTRELNEAPNVIENLGMLSGVVAAVGGDSKAAIVSAILTLGSQLLASSQGGGGGFGSVISAIFAANGGTMKGGFRPLADGGVIKTPTLGLVGEGRNNEAVVPLPNNREIPVEMRGGGETVNINMNQSFDFTNADANSVAQLRTEARMIEERTFNRVFTEINKGGKYAKVVGRRR